MTKIAIPDRPGAYISYSRADLRRALEALDPGDAVGTQWACPLTNLGFASNNQVAQFLDPTITGTIDANFCKSIETRWSRVTAGDVLEILNTLEA